MLFISLLFILGKTATNSVDSWNEFGVVVSVSAAAVVQVLKQ